MFLIEFIVDHLDEFSSLFNRLLRVNQIYIISIILLDLLCFLVLLSRVKSEWCGNGRVNRKPRLLNFCHFLWLVFVIFRVLLSQLFDCFDLWLNCHAYIWLAAGILLDRWFQHLSFKQFFCCHPLLLLFLFPISLTSYLLTIFDVCQVILNVSLPHVSLKFGLVFDYHFCFHCLFAPQIGFNLVFVCFRFLLRLLNLQK